MKLAVISAIRDDWDRAPAFLSELRSLLARYADFDASIWLVDDAAESRPASWHSLQHPAYDLHVIELQGRQGRGRAFASALGYLFCEREERFDAYLLLDGNDPKLLRELGPLFETQLHEPRAAVLAPGGPERGTLLARLTHRLGLGCLRALSGERLAQSPALLLPAAAAEALCHSCHAASHPEAALRRLRMATLPASVPRASCGLDVLAAASVYRDRVFERLLRASLLLLAATALLLPVLAAAHSRFPALSLIGLFALGLAAPLFAVAALVSLLFTLLSRSLDESRRWTPALDAPLLIREVTRVRRRPYAMPDTG